MNIAKTAKVLTASIGVFMSMAAVADPIGTGLDGEIDFRTAPWAACAGESTCIIGDVTVEAGNVSGPADIYWDSTDGFGVIGGQENDEIDGPNAEFLSLVFGTPELLSGIWFSDLFSGNGDPEEAANTRIILSGGAILDFMTFGTDPMGSSNGEVFLDFGSALLVSQILFGTPSELNDDHSVAGLVRASVPEPGTLALLGLGLAGMAMRRKQRKA